MTLDQIGQIVNDLMTQTPQSGVQDPLLVFAVILIAGILGGWIATLLRLPSITGNILAGILVGPYVWGLIDNQNTIESLRPMSTFAMGMITVGIGGHLSYRRLHNSLKRITFIAVGEAFCAFAFVAIGFHMLFPSQWAWPMALLLAALAVDSAPGTILHIVHEARAKGTYSKTLLSSVALDNILSITIFALTLMFVARHYAPNVDENSLTPQWLIPVWQIGGAIILGLFMGWLTGFLTRHPKFHNFSTVFVSILLCTGIASYIGMSPLLATLFLGVYLGNSTNDSEKQLHTLEPIELMVYVAFFTMAGVTLNPEKLTKIGMFGAMFVVLRVMGKASGAALGGILSGSSKRIWTNIPLGLMPQAGLVVGLVILLQSESRIPEEVRETIATLVLAAVVVNELVGPVLTKWAIKRAKEENKDRARLVEFIQEEFIATNFKAKDKEEAIGKLCDFLIRTHRVEHTDREALFNSVMEREVEESTAIGKGVALPHGTLEKGPSIQGVLGIFRDGVDWDAPDDVKVRLVMLIVTPREHQVQHLKVLRSLAAMVSDDVIRARLMAARDPNAAWEVIEGEETPDYNYFLEDRDEENDAAPA